MSSVPVEVASPEPIASVSLPATTPPDPSMGEDGVKDVPAGVALVRASRVFAVEDRARTWLLLGTTLLALVVAEVCTALAGPIYLKLVGALVVALINVRLFIFFHDYLHGAIFRDSRLMRIVMTVYGSAILTLPSVWRYAHDFHHHHNGKLLGWFIGEFPLVDVESWRVMSKPGKRIYRFARHPMTVLFAYLFLFIGRHIVYAVLTNPRRDWPALLVLIGHWAALAAVGLFWGWQTLVFNALLPMVLSMAMGSLLFYVQHNSPNVQYQGGKSWSYSYAALRSTTMLDMPRVMHWFTGNIGYHHVHHLNHRIPFYRLPEAMAAMPELQDPVRIRIRDIPSCFGVDLWDGARGRMVKLAELADPVET